MRAPVDLQYPGPGRWRVLNSPADRVPSHGTARWASSFAVDLVPVDENGRTAPVTASTLVRPEPPERFAGFGREILAPTDGIVLAVHDEQPDHPAYRGLPSLTYALTQGRRARGGWAAMAGNHVLVRVGTVVIALCHLRAGSIVVHAGERVEPGSSLAACGNSGNSTEPHVHLQAMDHPDPDRARAVPCTLAGRMPSGGEVVGPG